MFQVFTLIRFRSPLLAKSRLIFTPWVNKMFQFTQLIFNLQQDWFSPKETREAQFIAFLLTAFRITLRLFVLCLGFFLIPKKQHFIYNKYQCLVSTPTKLIFPVSISILSVIKFNQKKSSNGILLHKLQTLLGC